MYSDAEIRSIWAKLVEAHVAGLLMILECETEETLLLGI